MLRFDKKSISSLHIVFLEGEKQTSKMQGKLESRRGTEVKYLVFLRGQNFRFSNTTGGQGKKGISTTVQCSISYYVSFYR